MEVGFTRPLWLLLLLMLPILIYSHFFVYKQLKRRAFMFANFEAIRRVTGQGFVQKQGHPFVGKNLFLLFLRICTLMMIIFSISGVNMAFKSTLIDGDFVIAIDASSSMLANDYDPNRFIAAKDAITLFIKELNGDIAAGLVSFAGEPYIELELTKDKPTLLETLEKIAMRRSGGTDIAGALVAAVNLLQDSKVQKTVILLTDGQTTVGTDVTEAITYAKSKGVNVHTVGIATKTGGKFLNIESLSTLDEPTLIRIANMTGGHYIHPETSKELAGKMNSLLITGVGLKRIELSWQFMVIGVFLLLFEWVMSNTKYRSIP